MKMMLSGPLTHPITQEKWKGKTKTKIENTQYLQINSTVKLNEGSRYNHWTQMPFKLHSFHVEKNDVKG